MEFTTYGGEWAGFGLICGGIAFVIGMVVAVWAVWFSIRSMTGNTPAQKKNAALLANGRPGRAQIQQVGMGNMVVKIGVVRHVQMKLALQVQLDQEPTPYNVSMQMLVPEIVMPKMQPGEIVPVRVDHNDRNTMAIDLAAMGYMV